MAMMKAAQALTMMMTMICQASSQMALRQPHQAAASRALVGPLNGEHAYFLFGVMFAGGAAFGGAVASRA
jgi:hypothetical protein